MFNVPYFKGLFDRCIMEVEIIKLFLNFFSNFLTVVAIDCTIIANPCVSDFNFGLPSNGLCSLNQVWIFDKSETPRFSRETSSSTCGSLFVNIDFVIDVTAS